jgi:hypothetical protein
MRMELNFTTHALGRACSLYLGFLQHHRILRAKLLNQRFFKNRLVLSFELFFGKYQHLVEKYSVNCVEIVNDGIGN